MRESPIKRLVYAAFFSLLAGVLVAAYNPVDHVKADLRADASGVPASMHRVIDDLLHG
ncbi:hypothetical protein [Sphingomonas azotifigens]|uniref:hypothetical protein n=1 Tax=Sphingomonas azotifigens TaxID=330920 RepID=UPI001431BBDD|nr:hypothetical protein [Sphingomonas azotifigens]